MKRSEKQRRKGRIYPFDAEFQRIARRDKKAFSSDQCKEIEENSRMGNAGDLFKKIRDTKGIFHTKMGSIKDRNMNLKKGEILRKDGKNTKKSYIIEHVQDLVLRTFSLGAQASGTS